MRLWVRLIIIIWCDGVKIPLTVNENKSYVLVETAKFESVRKSAVNIDLLVKTGAETPQKQENATL